mmetsp:Transcript_5331/g.6210  ORF Transcript_5331/g.6210 Transcript_5331/m.6210 type:complete len:396 (+) Transcript_5331:118-1305(+)
MSMQLTPSMKEEVREHNVMITSFVPTSAPNKNDLSRRPPRPTSSEFTVMIESAERRENRRRKSKGWRAFCRKYGQLIIVFIVILGLLEEIDNRFSLEPWTEDHPVSTQRDFTVVQGIDDLTTDNVDAWCHTSRSRCSCQDPTVGDNRRESIRWWSRLHRINVEAASHTSDIDILLIGDSIVEGWMGTLRGHEIARAYGVREIFAKLFDATGNEAKYEGIALGISGDTSSNLLWRLQNGELPDNLNPKVIWVLIGSNDFGVTWCSPEIVLIGILRVVEELRMRKPNATIVINGLFPRTFHRKGYLMRGRPSFFGLTPKLPSLWRDFVSVNSELRQYGRARDRVEYFETDIFLVDKDAPFSELRIKNDLMPDCLHPSPDGYSSWGEQIVGILDQLIV